MHDVVDLHTHTIASGHAYNTIYEMARSAAEKGAALLGISDHAPAMEGAAGKYYFRSSSRVPRSLYGVQILFGAELNILNPEGQVDLDEEFSRPLDYAIASLHAECMRPGTLEQNTQAYLQAMEHPKVFILGHPDDGTFEADYEQLAAKAAQRHILIELNEASVRPGSYRKNARRNAYRLLSACRRWHTGIIVSSDAHIETEILQHHYALQMLEDMQFPEELIANVSAERALARLADRNRYTREHSV
ncbi:MAG: phosphatase [Clostridia bacterium]|nr:phosphatase [Clostridia bacterium]